MAKCNVVPVNPLPESVTLILTPEEAQVLHSLLGNLTIGAAKDIAQYGDVNLLLDGDGSVYDVLDNELHKYPYFNGTVG